MFHLMQQQRFSMQSTQNGPIDAAFGDRLASSVNYHAGQKTATSRGNSNANASIMQRIEA